MQAWTTLIDCNALQALLSADGVVVFDCRFVLTDPDAGEEAYLGGHIPGAFHAHLDRDLSGPSGDGGRHPLPDAESFAAWLSSHGVSDDTQVVVYDEGLGAFAARLWWMLRWLGHEQVAVLDGGLGAWVEQGFDLETAARESRAYGQFSRRDSEFKTVSLDAVVAASSEKSACLVDARSHARYVGDEEPFAPVAGHIPTARSRPFQSNCSANGVFKQPAELREAFGSFGPGEVVCYCGSGVTACHNILAAVHAGLPPPALFVGSWSQWVLDSTRPVATGAE